MTSKAKNVVEGRKYTKTRNWKHYGIEIRAKRKKNNTMDNLRIKLKVPFVHNKCPIFDKKRRELISIPDI